MPFSKFFLSGVALALLAALTTATDAQTPDAQPIGLVSPTTIEARISDAEQSLDLSEQSRTTLITLYRRALGNLDLLKSQIERSALFEEAFVTAEEEIRAIQQRTEEIEQAKPLEGLALDPEIPFSEREQQLKQEQAASSAARVRAADLSRRLAFQRNRPAAIRQRLAALEEQQQSIVATLHVEPGSNERPVVIQARRWVQETRYVALSAEGQALEKELLSLPARLTLLQSKLELERAKLSRSNIRVNALEASINEQRARDAGQAAAAAARAMAQTAGEDPVLVRLATSNAELTETLQVIASQLDALDRDYDEAERLSARTLAEFEATRETIETGGFGEALGALMLEHRANLPDIELYTDRLSLGRTQIAAAKAEELRYRDEARRVADLSSEVARLDSMMAPATPKEQRQQLRGLVEQRQHLLEQLLDSNTYYLEHLEKVNAVERRVLEHARGYGDFLNEKLFWHGKTVRFHPDELTQLPSEVMQLFDYKAWFDIGKAFTTHASRSPILWLGLFAVGTLFWQRRRLEAAIKATAEPIGKAKRDRLSHTLTALGLTLLAAAPLPLLLVVSGWTLAQTPYGTDVSHGVGVTLIRIGLLLAAILALRWLCIPGGVAERHFQWTERRLGVLRRELAWFPWAFLPAELIAPASYDLNVDKFDALTHVGFLAVYGAALVFVYRLLNRKNGVLAHAPGDPDAGVLYHSYRLWFPLFLLPPIVIPLLALRGYVFAATAFSSAYLNTLWLILGLVLLYALALRGLRITRRRLAWQEERDRRLAKSVAQDEPMSDLEEESTALQAKAEHIDLDALRTDTVELLRFTVAIVGAFGLYLIWSSVLPAFIALDAITLWKHTVVVDGEETLAPVTLFDLGLALFYLMIMGVLLRRLPALLEVILSERFGLSSGTRYAVTTLSSYVILGIGVVLAFSMLGADWSKLQWLVAALGVGIGFGLQEIVANFISGLIILFEQPIRVGDIVTVGTTDGVVTKIRIRATTIRNWDRKELLIPNKEIITGQVTNWMLSDSTTRVVIIVGVAYGSDVDKAMTLMREAAEEDERVLKDPPPILSFEGFDNDSLRLILRAYLGSLDQRIPTTTDLHRAINRKFNDNGITIAFPQRDMHFDRDTPLHIQLERTHRPRGSAVGSASSET